MFEDRIRFQWRIQKFQNWGAQQNSWGLGIVLMPLNTPYAFVQGFVDRVENKIHIVHISSLLPSKYICVLCSQNLQKQTQKYFQTGMRAPGAPVLDPPLGFMPVLVSETVCKMELHIFIKSKIIIKKFLKSIHRNIKKLFQWNNYCKHY